MTIDATFWVAISFIIFILLLFYFKIPAKVQSVLDDNINKIKGQIDEAESLKEEAKSNLANQEKKLADSKTEIQSMINDATSAADRKVKKSNEDLESFLKKYENEWNSTSLSLFLEHFSLFFQLSSPLTTTDKNPSLSKTDSILG